MHEAEDFDHILRRVTQRPWLPKDYLHVDAWLTLNEKTLQLVTAATERTHYFVPLVPGKTTEGTGGLPMALLPHAQPLRRIGEALVARAMLTIGLGNADGAWRDLLVCHSLARLVGKGATPAETLVGVALDNLACTGDVAFLDAIRPDSRRIQRCLSDLRQLAPLPAIADKIDLCGRCCILDSVLLVDRYGLHYAFRLAAPDGGGESTPTKKVDFWDLPNELYRQTVDLPETLTYLVNELYWRGIDWDLALRDINGWFDRIVAAIREKDREARVKRMEQVGHNEIAKLRVDVAMHRTEEISALKQNPFAADLKGKAIGEPLLGVLSPATIKGHYAAERNQQIQNNVWFAFALARYHRDHGRYPNDLSQLARRYLPEVPLDVFSGRPPIYRLTPSGYLLYSVGPNGQDDGGRGREDEGEPRGDDIAVRMPLPALPKK